MSDKILLTVRLAFGAENASDDEIRNLLITGARFLGTHCPELHEWAEQVVLLCVSELRNRQWRNQEREAARKGYFSSTEVLSPLPLTNKPLASSLGDIIDEFDKRIREAF